MARIVWTRKALDNLNLIDAYIHQFDPDAAQRFANRLKAAAQSLQHFPHRGRPTKSEARELAIVPPYVIRYVVQEDIVFILGIRHGRQNSRP